MLVMSDSTKLLILPYTSILPRTLTEELHAAREKESNKNYVILSETASFVGCVWRGGAALTHCFRFLSLRPPYDHGEQGAQTGVLKELYGMRVGGRLYWEPAGSQRWFELMRGGDHASIVTTLSAGSLSARDFSSTGETLAETFAIREL